MKAKKKKNVMLQVLVFAVFICAGLVVGLAVGSLAKEAEFTGMETIFVMAGLVVLLEIMLLLQIIVHEAGHLAGGLLSGYKFLSFRVGSFMILKRDGRFHIKRFSLAGTGGQCLLIPPQWQGKDTPYILYNLGGPLINIIIGTAAVILYFFATDVWTKYVLLAIAVSGLAIGLLNGIPLNAAGINNDGSNIRSIAKDEKALRAFWIIMKVNQFQTEGRRMKDISDEYISMLLDEDLKNPITSTNAVFFENKMMDQHDFAAVKKLCDELLNKDTAIVGIYKSLLKADRIYCGIMDGEDVSSYIDKEYKTFVNQMKDYPAVLRTEFACAAAEHDAQKLDKILTRFHDIEGKYPNPGDIETERELIEIVKEKYQREEL